MKKVSMFIFFPILLLISVFFSAVSCSHEPSLISDLDTVCFETQILPVMQTSCGITGCHSSAGGESGFVATNYSSIVEIVTPGNARKSKLYEVITTLYGENIMPPDRPLSKSQRMLIEVWIEQGALNTTCSEPTIPDTTIGKIDTLCFKQSVEPIIVTSCAKSSCHNSTSHVEGYNLSDYLTIMNSGDGVVPYNPSATKIYQVLFATGEERMPPSPLPALTTNQKEAIRRWIAEGAENSDCPASSCDTLNAISFTNQIWPLMNNNCTGCHNTSTHSGNVDLSSYTQINYYSTETRNSIPILPGVLKSQAGFRPMPPSGSLDECAIRMVELWIDQGKQEN